MYDHAWMVSGQYLQFVKAKVSTDDMNVVLIYDCLSFEEQINMNTLTSSLVAIQDIVFSFVSLTLFQSPFSIRCNEEGRYYTQSSQ